MPLLQLHDIRDDLICPHCQAPLASAEHEWLCTKCSRAFPLVQGIPVLVNFETSVLTPDWALHTGGATLVKRNSPRSARSTVSRLLNGTNAVATENIQALLAMALRRRQRPRILIVGGGAIGSGIGSLYTDPRVDLIGFDIYASENVQFIGDAHLIPLRDACVDAVVIQAVLEHVIDPHRVVSETERVLPQGGLIYAETPFLQHVHEGPYDFCRFTESGHRYLFRHFSEIRAGAVAGAGTQTVWALEYLVRSLFRSREVGHLARGAFFWLRWLDLLIPPDYAVDAASGCYFLGAKSEDTITPRQLIERYKGAQRTTKIREN